jgi:uncharacterized membrane protein YkoI
MRACVLILALAVPGLAAAAVAAPPGGGAVPARLPAVEHREDGAPLTLDDAVELVKRRYDARVVRAEEEREGEELWYRIRLLAADGRVFTVRVNARTGSVE